MDLTSSRLSPHWWAVEGTERADALVALVDTLADSQRYRQDKALASVSLFEGRQLPGLGPQAYEHDGDYTSDDYDALVWNIPRSLALTVQAKIAGTQKPKVQFVVTDGDWSIKRKAKKLDKFVEGQMHQRQGQYADIWQLGQQIVLDACVLDGNCGALKVTADFHDRKVCCERVWPWEVYYDPHEVRAGNPRTIYHRYRYDRDALKRQFAGDADKLALIHLAEAADDRDDAISNTDRRATDQVWVYEAWRISHGDDTGQHTLAVSSGELYSEEWLHDGFPFVFLYWTRELCGAWGKSLVCEAEPMSDEVNFTIDRMREGEKKLSNGVVFVEEGSVDDDVLTSNDIGRVVEYHAGKQPPTYHQPAGYSQSTVRWLEMNVEKTYELPGVSQMGATARKEQGVDAAIAMRTMNDIQTERFSVFASAYEQMYVDIAKRMVWATRDLAAEHGDIIARWPGESVMRELSWSEVDLPEETYRIRPYAVGGIKNTPADRLSLAQDMLGAGVLSPDAFGRVTQHLDTPGEFGRANKQREWVGKLIESWLDYNADEDEDFVQQAPIPFMALEDAILQVAEAYFEALIEDVPDANQEFFLTWMEQCDKLLLEKVQKMAAAQAPPGPPPGAMPPPMPMPPPGPMPGALPPPGPAPPAAMALPPAA